LTGRPSAWTSGNPNVPSEKAVMDILPPLAAIPGDAQGTVAR
jgi:hypothetical protein